MKWRNILFVVIATIMIAAHGTYSQEKPVGEVSVQQARPNESLEALFPKAETVAPGSSFHERALEDLLSTNATVRYDATLALSGQRSALVAGLIRILDGSNAVDIKVYAVVVLGQYRAAEAVPILVQHWEWDQEGGHVVLGTSGPQRIERDEFSRPVSTALVNIGSRAIPYLLDRIASAGDVATMWKCVAICREIEGLDVTEMRLQNRLD